MGRYKMLEVGVDAFHGSFAARHGPLGGLILAADANYSRTRYSSVVGGIAESAPWEGEGEHAPTLYGCRPNPCQGWSSWRG